MTKTCKCGCGETTKLATKTSARDGWIKGQPLDYVNGHNARSTKLAYQLEDRGHGTPCWIWQRAKDRDGYGLTRINYKQQKAHRVAYENTNGTIPDGLVLDHLCRQPSCVNPDHLEPVTSAENRRRGAGIRFSLETAQQARDMAQTGMSYRQIALALNIPDPTLVGYAVRGDTWSQ